MGGDQGRGSDEWAETKAEAVANGRRPRPRRRRAGRGRGGSVSAEVEAAAVRERTFDFAAGGGGAQLAQGRQPHQARFPEGRRARGPKIAGQAAHSLEQPEARRGRRPSDFKQPPWLGSQPRVCPGVMGTSRGSCAGKALDTTNPCRSEVAQSCPILCDPIDCSLPGSFVHGIFQARILE